MLPDDVLLDIFHFHVVQPWEERKHEEKTMKAWQSLVHVCRRWRSVVFGSPRRLNLRLVCSSSTPAGDTADIWPALPLVIEDWNDDIGSVDNIVALLERSDLVRRITQITLWGLSSSQLEDTSEAMQVPFPELTVLLLHRYDGNEQVLPLSDSFLGGSAPQLRSLYLNYIPYPGLPKLLLSATHLTDLHLHDIPHSGYISPEAMVACLSTLTSLERLSLGFESPLSRPDMESRRLRPQTRTVLPVLGLFRFRGVGEYLEDLVACIDAPRLGSLDITFFNDIVFDTPQLTQFIRLTPTFKAFDIASVVFLGYTATITLSRAHKLPNGTFKVGISCRELDWQLSFLEQVCTSSLPPLSTLEDLYIMEGPKGRPWPQDWKDITDYAQWLELLHSFTAVKNLYLSKELAPCVVSALQDLVGSRTTEVFPSLRNMFLEELQESGPVQGGIEKFATARQVNSNSIAVSRWDRGY